MPFNFLLLPQEVQDQILTIHLECKTLQAVGLYLTPGRPAKISGVPSLDIESVCKKLNHDAKQIRSKTWPTSLGFSTILWPERMMIASIMQDSKYCWLHNHIRHISVTETRFPIHGSNFKFKHLERVTVCKMIRVSPLRSATYSPLIPFGGKVSDLYVNRLVCKGFYNIFAERISGKTLDALDLEVRVTIYPDLEPVKDMTRVVMSYKYRKDEWDKFQPYLFSKTVNVDGKRMDTLV